MEQEIVYVTGTDSDNHLRQEFIAELIGFISEELGLPVLSEHNPGTQISGVTKDKRSRQDPVIAGKIERQCLAWINKVGYVIAEVSGDNTGTGREIEYARTKHENGHKKAKVLCVFHVDSTKTSPMILGMSPACYDNVKIYGYRDIEDLQQYVRRFLAIALSPDKVY